MRRIDPCRDRRSQPLTSSPSLSTEGVLVAAKDFNAPTHPEIADVKNLEVIKAMQSLTSKGYVKTQCPSPARPPRINHGFRKLTSPSPLPFAPTSLVAVLLLLAHPRGS